MKDKPIVCNIAGHFDNEIDMSSLESFSGIKVENIQLLRRWKLQHHHTRAHEKMKSKPIVCNIAGQSTTRLT